MTLGAVIFDVDGTLVDSNDAHARAWVAAFAEAGITAPFDAVRRAIGMGGDKLLRRVAGIDESSAQGQRLTRRRAEIFRRDELPSVSAFPGTRPLAERLAADGYALAVASSAKAEELQPLLERADLADLLANRTSSDDADESKPDPDIVQAAMARTGVPPEQTIMIGDTPYDLESATRAGVALIAVESGGWRARDLSSALAVYRDVAQILAAYDTSPFARPHRSAITPGVTPGHPPAARDC